MERISNSLKINDFISVSQLKKKFKIYLEEHDCTKIKQSNFPQALVLVSVMLLEEILSDCLKYIFKHEINGLYIINSLILQTSLNETSKYDFTYKYSKKYNYKIRYADNVFFNIKKVFDNLESKYGDKLMIDVETRNYISYILMSLQYDISDLCLKVIKYANKKTLNNNVLMVILSNYMTDDIITKFRLKLDSTITENTNDDNDDNDENEVDMDIDEDSAKGETDVIEEN